MAVQVLMHIRSTFVYDNYALILVQHQHLSGLNRDERNIDHLEQKKINPQLWKGIVFGTWNVL